LSVLIVVVSPYVYDTAAVAWGLRRLRHEVDIWFPEDYPAHQSLSLEFDSNGTVGIHSTPSEDGLWGKTMLYKTIWLRHRLRISENSTLASSSDAAFAAKEADHLVQSILHLLSPSALWVNRPLYSEKAFLKPLQLATAFDVGFCIPRTLMSNNPESISEFISSVGGLAVFKTFNAATWEVGGDNYFQSMSTLIDKNMIGTAAALCPAIYQEIVSKQADIRVIVIGKQLFAVKQDSSKSRYIDSRLSGRMENPNITPTNLPESIQLQCLHVMERLRLVFGCIDLALDESGNYWFLEVNPNGQFLAYEEICPSLPLLDTFCRFLISSNPEYLLERRRSHLRLKDFLKADGQQASLEWQLKHTQSPAKHVYQD